MQKRRLTKRGKINLTLFTTIIILIVSIILLTNIGNGYNLKKSVSKIEKLLAQNKLNEVTDVLAEINENVNITEHEKENNIIKTAVSTFVRQINEDYISKELTYEEAMQNINWAESTGFNVEEVKDMLDNINRFKESEINLLKAEQYYNSNDYEKAIEYFSKVSEDYPTYKTQISEYVRKIKNDYVKKAKQEAGNYNYKKAVLLMDSISSVLPDKDLVDLLTEYETKSNEVFEYEGLVEHIFFHDLVIDPVRAFAGKRQEFFDYYFVSIDEYKAMLEEMYKNNYVLVDVYSLFDVVDGKTIQNKIYLPEGKKPLIISTDDMNYYEIDRPYGLAEKAVVDENGNLGHLYTDAEGKKTIRYDADIVTITEQFIKENPDFSYNGARLCLGFTGNEGLLGYKTHEPDSKDYEKEKEEVLKVIAKLKELGYKFASHSYYHYTMTEKSLEVVKEDTKKWLNEVGSLLGEPVQVFLYPMGEGFEPEDPRLEYMISKGFRFFGEVGNHIWIKTAGDALIQGRRHVDGITLKRQDDLKTLFDSKVVVNENRSWVD